VRSGPPTRSDGVAPVGDAGADAVAKAMSYQIDTAFGPWDATVTGVAAAARKASSVPAGSPPPQAAASSTIAPEIEERANRFIASSIGS
jgi:hypothetical protein